MGQRQINVKTTLCISTLEFTTSNNVESTLCISTLIWTMLDNVETTFSVSMSNFTMLGNVETTFSKWPFPKRTKKIISNWIYWIQSFNCYFIILLSLRLEGEDTLKYRCVCQPPFNIVSNDHGRTHKWPEIPFLGKFGQNQSKLSV